MEPLHAGLPGSSLPQFLFVYNVTCVVITLPNSQGFCGLWHNWNSLAQNKSSVNVFHFYCFVFNCEKLPKDSLLKCHRILFYPLFIIIEGTFSGLEKLASSLR
jgi:hypothetical protein